MNMIRATLSGLNPLHQLLVLHHRKVLRKDPKVHARVWNPANPLKLVCHQTHIETRDQELNYNAVTSIHEMIFVRHKIIQIPAITQFFDFAAATNPNNLNWLTKVIITRDPRIQQRATTYLRDSSENIIPFATFCKAHPHLSIDFVIPCFSICETFPWQFLHQGVCLTHILRNQIICDLVEPGGNLAPYQPGNEWRAARPDEDFWAPNLKFFPTCREKGKLGAAGQALDGGWDLMGTGKGHGLRYCINEGGIRYPVKELHD
ncbi:hypothetical protein P154DRAFT_562670 [Amniculicola lignicola CBS 123094]|uniref:Uncharacterized protein n=1 Tax=Amniculicola lignicola CBS 123094 TaxID=1392246 RepID=A0A6A5WKM8_9PLEO|nr:hypothetical protein P154DRAFT_562670 [Amniculicola lignicola CBS 123094]